VVRLKGIRLKKKFGQHFLRDESVAQQMINAVVLSKSSSVFEIGCGEGFITRLILRKSIARLWSFEIDPAWVRHVRQTIDDTRLMLYEKDFLTVDMLLFKQHKPWTLIASLAYQITFPVLYVLQKNRYLIKEAVIIIQEEVAQKLVSKGGRSYGFVSLFFQRFFTFDMYDKILPSAFYPAPKVMSRILYFFPRETVPTIICESDFWRFVKICFKQPRRTLRNNICQTEYDITKIPESILSLRAQQLSMEDFLYVWDLIR